jgi:hypothetical protein
MGLFKKPEHHRRFAGTYYGSNPAMPEPIKTMQVDVTTSRVRLVPIGFTRTRPVVCEWDDIISFEFEGEIVNGIFKTTLHTTSGDWVIEARELKGGTKTNPHLYATNLQQKLSFIKVMAIRKAKERQHNPPAPKKTV